MQIVLLLVTHNFLLDHFLVENTWLEVIAFSFSLLLLLGNQVLVDIIINLHDFHVLLSSFIEVNLSMAFTLATISNLELLLLFLDIIEFSTILLNLLLTSILL